MGTPEASWLSQETPSTKPRQLLIEEYYTSGNNEQDVTLWPGKSSNYLSDVDKF